MIFITNIHVDLHEYNVYRRFCGRQIKLAKKTKIKKDITKMFYKYL